MGRGQAVSTGASVAEAPRDGRGPRRGGAVRRGGCPSGSEGEAGLGGGGRESASGGRKCDSELTESGLGGGAGGMDGVDAAAASAGALQDIGAEGVLVQRRPVEAALLLLLRW
jgi:hypothetical protein